jgi:putative transposase
VIGSKPTLKQTLTFYRLPQAHHQHLKSTNLLERLNEELKRRTLVVRIFPNTASCLRSIRALAVEIKENWIEATRYLNMELLSEQKKGATETNPHGGMRGCGYGLRPPPLPLAGKSQHAPLAIRRT